MEGINAVITAPLCFLAVAAYLTGSPYCYAVQLIVSLLQLYGTSLYFLTEIKDNFIHSEMYHPLHFWFYFWFLNAFWIIVPLISIGHSVTKIFQSQSVADANDVSHNKRR